MYPNRLAYSLAFTTAVLLAFPQGWCCAAHLGQVWEIGTSFVSGAISDSSALEGDVKSDKAGSCHVLAPARPVKVCCLHAHARPRKSPAMSGTSEVVKGNLPAETILPTCPASSPDSQNSDRCCLGAPPLAPPTSQVEPPETQSLVGEVVPSMSRHFRSAEREVTFTTSTSSIARHKLFCVWRC